MVLPLPPLFTAVGWVAYFSLMRVGEGEANVGKGLVRMTSVLMVAGWINKAICIYPDRETSKPEESHVDATSMGITK